MSDTPRTDAVTEHFYTSGVGLRSGSFVEASVARTLERDLNAAKVERVALAVELNAAKADLAQRTADLDRMTGQRNAALDAREITQRTLDGIDGVLSQRTAERDEARREVCYAYGSRAETLAAAERRGWDCFKEGNKTC
jgi:hypothetical protein